MRNDFLPSPGAFNKARAAHQALTQAISQLQLVATFHANGKAPDAKQFSAFLYEAKLATDAVADFVLPALVSRQILAGTPDQVRLTYDDRMDGTVTPTGASFSLTAPARTVTAVKVSGNVVVLTVNTPYAAGDTAPLVAYNVPAVNALRDLSGNLAPAYTASGIVRA